MSNVIVKKEDAVPTSFSVHAEGDGIAVGYTDSFSPTINLFLSDGTKTASRPRYFNLIIGYDPFEKDYILVDKSRALTEYITDEVKNEFRGWSDGAVEKIKKLPAIIAMERDGTEEQQALFAFIKNVRDQDNGVKVYFQRFFPIPFSFLTDNLSDLAMHLFELTRTHWTIKKVDLLEVMQDAGVFPGNQSEV